MITGHIKDFSTDFFTGKQKLTLEIEGDCSEEIKKIGRERITVKLKKYSKRSNNANNYYWKIVHKIASSLNVSDMRIHNLMLRSCRCLEMINGETIAVKIPDTDSAEDQTLERSDIHLMPTSETDGERRTYLLLRGSSSFSTKEMARLIDLAIQEAQEMGVDIPMSEENIKRKK